MVPAFGFSAGDFIAAINLIAKVSAALKDHSGASQEYQNVILELQALERTLQHLQALKPNESNAAHINAIRGMALTCRVPLLDFLQKIVKYEQSLGPFSKKGRLNARSFCRKSQWAIFTSEDVARLRTAIGAKVLTINLLLATHTSESISRLEARAHRSHVTLMVSLFQQRTEIADLKNEVNTTKKSVETHAETQRNNNKELQVKVEDAAADLRVLSEKTEGNITAVMSFRSLGSQILQAINHLPRQIREMMEKVVRSNLEMYSMLHTIHTSILRSPSYDPADTFQFEDALGRSRRLPYEYFRRVEIFNAFLAAEFQGLPGEKKISDRQYIISKEDSEGNSIMDEEWSVTVFPGSSILMSMLVASFTSQAQANQCPRSGCSGYGQRFRGQAFLRCKECNVEFAVPSGNVRVRKEPLNWLPMTRESNSHSSITPTLNSPTNKKPYIQ